MKKKNIVLDSILDTFRKNPAMIFLLLFVTIGVVLTALLPPQILRIIIDEYLLKNRYDKILFAAISYFLVLLLNHLFEFLKSILFVNFGQSLSQSIQQLLSQKLTTLKTSYFTNHNHGEIASYIINDADTINSVFTTGLLGILIDLLKIAGILVSIYIFSGKLLAVICLFLPVMLVTARFAQKALLSAQLENRSITGNLNNAIAETKEIFPMIQLSGKQKFMTNRWHHLLKENYKSSEKINLADSLSSPITQILKASAICVTIYIASANLGITIGMLAASIELITNLFDPLETITAEIQSLQKAVSGIKRVNDLYNEEDESTEYLNYSETLLNAPPAVEFKNVSFSYQEDTPVLKDISFYLAGGGKRTITGRTGIGKTTLFYLLTGLYKPHGGLVTINHINAYQIKPDDKRKLYAYISQNFVPIMGTIKDQITLKDRRITDLMVYDAAKTVGLNEEILALYNGYDTLYDKTLLSEGQEQLLSIARAIVLNPHLLLLDEMSAKLDSVSEKRVYTALESIGKDKTILAISHRHHFISDSIKLT